VTVLRNFDWCHSLKLAGVYGPPLANRGPARPWFIHLAEGIDEVAQRELDVLRESRGLDGDTVIVHGTGLTATQVATSVAAGASLVWCPASNHRLFGKTVFHRQFFHAGRLALGSDSRLSGSRDLLDELRVARKESGLSPREILQIATEAGERVCQMPPGEDQIVLGVNGGDAAEALLAATRRDLALVIRRGLPVLGDAEFEETLLESGVPVIRFQLDGKPKVGDSRVFRREIFDLEPGLSLS
jgi:cytosine/adenosine deaminase-related metal-dependent hydrolase